MLLGALLDAGADEDFMRRSILAVAPERTTLSLVRVQRGSLWGNHALVEVADSSTRRGLRDVVGLISGANLQPEVKRHAIEIFSRLGAAEAAVHGVSVNDVHFHEVGALDAIADIVGVCAGFVSLDLAELHCSPVAVGSGTIQTSHGEMSVPAPAVVNLLRGAPTYAGPAATELCTPTGAALLAHWVTTWGTQPMMTVDQIGTGCGTTDFSTHANVIRRSSSASCTTRASPRRALRDQRRRPRPPPMARDPAATARRRCVRCLADPDPHEEGPAGVHLVRAPQGRCCDRRP